MVVLDHFVQPVRGSRRRVRFQKFTNKPRGVYKPTNKNVKTITKDGLLKAVEREAKKVSKQVDVGGQIVQQGGRCCPIDSS